MAPRGVVKLVLDGLIDTLNMDINKGFSVQLGEFGCFRPGINAKSQDKLEDVTASTIYRRKIIFTPGFYFRGHADPRQRREDGLVGQRHRFWRG